MDALSDVLRLVELTGAVYLHAAFSAPWSVVGHADSALCAAYLPPTERVVSFHLVTEGCLWVALPGDRAGALRAEAGDVIVIPQGETHALSSDADLAPVSLGPLVETSFRSAPEVMELDHGGGGARTRLVCGFLAVHDVWKNPLLSALPRLFKVRMRGSSGEWLEPALRFAVREAASGNAGSATIVAKLAELLFVEAIRRHIEAMPDDGSGWLAGLRDRFVGRALSLLHAHPAHAWTVAELARAVGMSRSVLAQRFTALLGVPPMQYLAQWRLRLAARQLRLGDRPLAAIADDVGYESEAAFNRAFKREFGVPPATWRRNAARS